MRCVRPFEMNPSNTVCCNHIKANVSEDREEKDENQRIPSIWGLIWKTTEPQIIKLINYINGTNNIFQNFFANILDNAYKVLKLV